LRTDTLNRPERNSSTAAKAAWLLSHSLASCRPRSITGPYLDKEGTPMMEGGGTLLIEGTAAWRGPGGQSVLPDANRDLLVFHAYDGATGSSTLQISTIVWEDGWPRVGVLPHKRELD